MQNFKDFSQNYATVLYPGGFKPPHKGHFAALQYLINQTNASQAVVFIGNKDRDGITAKQSKVIWEIYAKYLDIETLIEISPITPVKSVYDYVDKDPTKPYIVGAGKDDLKRFEYFDKNKEKYPKVQVVSVPDQFGRISGTAVRKGLMQGKRVNFMPKISLKDKEVIYKLLLH
jgi:nicotinic acid mononucleotide adenylyltransferase